MASVVANNINNNENSNLDVQLHNSKKFVSMLQQTAWVLNNLIKLLKLIGISFVTV